VLLLWQRKYEKILKPSGQALAVFFFQFGAESGLDLLHGFPIQAGLDIGEGVQEAFLLFMQLY